MEYVPWKHVYFILNTCNGSKFLPLSKHIYNARNNLRFATASYCTNSMAVKESNSDISDNDDSKRISQAMESYLKRTMEYERFIKEQNEAYEKGKKFLAKIMDVNPESFTEEKIDQAIEYLFPSGLFDKKARPCFKDPTILFPKQKEAQFDRTGRPYHFLFYTTKPNFYQLLHVCGKHLDNLNKKYKEWGPDAKPPRKSLTATGTTWLKKKKLEEKLVEHLIDVEYETFLESMNRLLEHPYSYEVADFILDYREVEHVRKNELTLPPKVELENGQTLVFVEGFRKKRCFATVKILSPGTGKILVNGKEIIDVFPDIRTRGQVSILN